MTHVMVPIQLAGSVARIARCPASRRILRLVGQTELAPSHESLSNSFGIKPENTKPRA
jgi:hypothetical protein